MCTRSTIGWDGQSVIIWKVLRRHVVTVSIGRAKLPKDKVQKSTAHNASKRRSSPMTIILDLESVAV